MKRVIFILFLLLFVVGCVAPRQSLQTESKKPEITLKAYQKDVFVNRLTGGFIKDGWQLVDESKTRMIWEKPTSSDRQFMGSFLMGAVNDRYRMTLMFIEYKDTETIRIIFDFSELYQKPNRYGPASEIRIDLNNSEDAHKLQEILDKLEQEAIK